MGHGFWFIRISWLAIDHDSWKNLGKILRLTWLLRVILMYLSLSQSQSSLSDPTGVGSRLELIVISQLEGIYSQIEDVFQCVKADSNDSQIHHSVDYVTSRLNLEIRKFKFSNSSKSILESSMIQFIRKVSLQKLGRLLFGWSEYLRTWYLQKSNFSANWIFSLFEWTKHFTSVKLKLAN